jgi:hypothetical protein
MSAAARLIAGILLCASARLASGDDAPTEGPKPQGLARWLDPSTAPFIPVPDIDVDPNSGVTLGLIPTWLVTDSTGEIRDIIAPDVMYNPNFGYGAHGRVYAYPSEDTQWSVVGGAKERVESALDFEFQTGRLRAGHWSFNASLVYDRSGTPRFYGVGNDSPTYDETDYTEQQKYVQTTLGCNLDHAWQIAYTLRDRSVEVQPGTLAGIASLQTRFGRILGVGTNDELLNRVSLTFDTRDDPTIPKRGSEVVVYGGVASRDGVPDASLYSVTGWDARHFWPVGSDATVAGHVAMRYMPGATRVPFWSLSSLGGDQSALGDAQPLRAYPQGRFYDRNSFSSSFEYRAQVLSIDAVSTHIELEVTPFTDLGEVFAHSRTSPVAQLHKVAGIGFRGVAKPFVVGYVDIGYGSEGVAAFTGINYPF